MRAGIIRWKSLPHELIDYSLARKRAQHHEQTQKTLEQLLEDYLHDPRSDTGLLLLNVTVSLSNSLGDWARIARSVYENSLELKRLSPTSGFILSVYKKVVVPEVLAERDWSIESFEDLAQKRGIPPGLLTVESLHDTVRAILSDWRRDTKERAKAFRRRARTLRPRSKAKSDTKHKPREAEVSLTVEQWRKMPSISQKQAAQVLVITDRTVRNRIRDKRLNATPSGRVHVDAKLEDEYSRQHGPAGSNLP